MKTREIACIELVEMLTDYIEGTLPPAETTAVKAHLVDCPPCRRYLEQLRTTIRALGTVSVQSLSDEAFDTLLVAFAANRAPHRPGGV